MSKQDNLTTAPILLNHLTINVSDVEFYYQLFTALGWKIMGHTTRKVSATDGQVGIWCLKFASKFTKNGFHRKNIGLNHLAFRVDSRAAIEHFYQDFVAAKGLTDLYDGPREYSQYNQGKGYFATFFEDPDRLKLEICYIAKEENE
jgi:catechol 2,3-dioxygenase-like lactoylglutathione lyase family enzyme